MNVDLGKWDVAKVNTLSATFQSASEFTGGGLESWITSAVTKLISTFYKASSMNVDVGKWNVAKTTDLESTFDGAGKFTG